MSENLSSLREPAKVMLLIVALATIPLFVVWMHVQEVRKKPALIPNSLWKNSTFSATCVMVLLSWATLQSLEWFISLLFVPPLLLGNLIKATKSRQTATSKYSI